MRRYLLLDDNRAFAENLAEILRDEGDQATVVTSGDEALRLARTTRFDALLTDMRMPGMSGADAVHHLRRVDPGLAAVVITAYPREDDLETARREGLLAVLPKPVPIPTLVGLLSGARRDGLVVLVEDDPALSDNLTEVLRAKGFSCVTACSVLDTDRISCVEPFAALVDLRVPGGPDGEALRRLRARYPNLSTFIITAFPDAVPTEGASGVFSKPFDTRALVHALETAYAARPARVS
ncbi:response regulator [Myxococcus sp. RHSTA-1-4]|uniref:response regulator n=1 Tax=Myxococcus sp. RHSTA-1-4 TaxID=2874601 RepID=UPI001CC04B59|nr:response regulator [Myxococcus sp. RHSTA-1-4]MBZ4420905.1 response regulator [Myxococcus sp. RHSTA-1-4]